MKNVLVVLVVAMVLMFSGRVYAENSLVSSTPLCTISGTVTQSAPYKNSNGVMVQDIGLVSMVCKQNVWKSAAGSIYPIFGGQFDYTTTSGLNLDTTNTGLISKTADMITLYARVSYTSPDGVFCLYDTAILSANKNTRMIDLKIMNPMGTITYKEIKGILNVGGTIIF